MNQKPDEGYWQLPLALVLIGLFICTILYAARNY